jgi:serine/threonine protein kinase
MTGTFVKKMKPEVKLVSQGEDEVNKEMNIEEML